jgi:hypothetical protein
MERERAGEREREKKRERESVNRFAKDPSGCKGEGGRQEREDLSVARS